MPKILFAEDKLSYKADVEAALSAAGFDVIGVEDGAKAIEQLEYQEFDLILTDYCMPEKNGGDVARAALKKGYKKIIINSAMADELEPIVGVEIVSKMTPQEVVAKIQAILST